MVDMRMSQQNRVDFARVEREWAVVELFLCLGALHHAAIDKHADPARLDQETGSGDGAAGSMKCEAHGRSRHDRDGRLIPLISLLGTAQPEWR